MAVPKRKSIQLALLRAIADADGELGLKEAADQVATFFPELTEEDRRRRHASGHLVWPNFLQWARLRLVEQGHLYREPRGRWRITPQGRVHLEEH
jgi:restriction endonuclease Mrr